MWTFQRKWLFLFIYTKNKITFGLINQILKQSKQRIVFCLKLVVLLPTKGSLFKLSLKWQRYFHSKLCHQWLRISDQGYTVILKSLKKSNLLGWRHQLQSCRIWKLCQIHVKKLKEKFFCKKKCLWYTRSSRFNTNVYYS